VKSKRTSPPNQKLVDLAKKLRDHALDFPETTEAFPWGESAFKVKGKTFVFMRADPNDLSFSVKLSKSRKKGLALPGSEPTHYGMGAKGWVTLRRQKLRSISCSPSLTKATALSCRSEFWNRFPRADH
jgi:predicted DNA-binding protein (MmcQ/YjbR family)